MKVIYPVSKIEKTGFKIFLAGTIDMGISIDWQQKIIDYFQNMETKTELIF